MVALGDTNELDYTDLFLQLSNVSSQASYGNLQQKHFIMPILFGLGFKIRDNALDKIKGSGTAKVALFLYTH